MRCHGPPARILYSIVPEATPSVVACVRERTPCCRSSSLPSGSRGRVPADAALADANRAMAGLRRGSVSAFTGLGWHPVPTKCLSRAHQTADGPKQDPSASTRECLPPKFRRWHAHVPESILPRPPIAAKGAFRAARSGCTGCAAAIRARTSVTRRRSAVLAPARPGSACPASSLLYCAAPAGVGGVRTRLRCESAVQLPGRCEFRARGPHSGGQASQEGGSEGRRLGDHWPLHWALDLIRLQLEEQVVGAGTAIDAQRRRSRGLPGLPSIS